MSESTAGGNRLSFVVEWGCSKRLPWKVSDWRLPARGEGFSNPGLFDKWRWRKRNVDGGVLADLGIFEGCKAFGVSGSDERLRRYTFKGYTIVARDVNRRRLIGFGW
jgi:hypothetical protein